MTQSWDKLGLPWHGRRVESFRSCGCILPGTFECFGFHEPSLVEHGLNHVEVRGGDGFAGGVGTQDNYRIRADMLLEHMGWLGSCSKAEALEQLSQFGKSDGPSHDPSSLLDSGEQPRPGNGRTRELPPHSPHDRAGYVPSSCDTISSGSGSDRGSGWAEVSSMVRSPKNGPGDADEHPQAMG